MKRAVALVAILIFASTTARAGSYFVDFQQSNGVNLCDLVFRSTPPSPKRIDELLRKALRSCIARDASQDILAMAFENDDALDEERQYNGSLVYRHATGQVQTRDQIDNAHTTVSSQPDYFVKVTERDRPCCVSPIKHYAEVDVVYAHPPSEAEGYGVAASIAKKYGKPGEDVYVTIEQGNRNSPLTWRAVHNSGGKSIAMRYDGSNGSVSREW